MAEVALTKVSKSFGEDDALNDLTMTVPDGSFVVLLGPTGAGKTTTLRIVSGLDKPDRGQVYIGGRDMSLLTPAQRNIAMVFQQYSLYPHLTVRENLEFPLKSPALKTPKVKINLKVGEVAEVLQISHKLDNKATDLSGGEMQRVSIGRALVRNPSVYLMDEPLSSLDAKLRADLRIELKRIQATSGATLLYVTHDQIEAMTMADKIVVMQNGHIEQVGSPLELYDSPANTFVAGFIGSPAMNMIKTSVSIDPTAGPQALIGKAFLNLPLVVSLKAGQEILIGIRPENLLPAADGIAGEITVIEPTGSETHVVVRSDGQDFVSVLRERPEYRPGQSIKLSAAVEDLHVFDADSLRRLNDPH